MENWETGKTATSRTIIGGVSQTHIYISNLGLGGRLPIARPLSPVHAPDNNCLILLSSTDNYCKQQNLTTQIQFFSLTKSV